MKTKIPLPIIIGGLGAAVFFLMIALSILAPLGLHIRNTMRQNQREEKAPSKADLEIFLRVTLEKLYSYEPNRFDISGVEPLIRPSVTQVFAKAAERVKERRIQYNRRQVFEMENFREYKDPNFSQFLTAVVKGKTTKRETFSDISGRQQEEVKEKNTAIIVYMEQTEPSPQNPYGLVISGVCRITPDKKAREIWEQAGR